MPVLRRAASAAEQAVLREIYLSAEMRIVGEIARLRGAGNVDYHAVAALERVQRILAETQTAAERYVPQMVEREFYVKHPEARRIPETVEKHRAGYANAEALTATQTDIVERLVMNLLGQLEEASATVQKTLESGLLGRTTPDRFRRVGLSAVALMEATGEGSAKAAKSMAALLHREGVTAFVDRAGRKWNLHTYADMVCRTTARQAEVLALLTRDPAQDLYKISAHGTTCPVCAPLEGRVYSRSGTDPDFPPLSLAFGKVDPDGGDDLANTWLNIHPNCLHALIPWTPAGRSDEEIAQIKRFSSPRTNPLDRDPRAQAQIDAYRKKEQARAAYLRSRRQWERYKAVVGDGVPSFETFLRHKAANSGKYRLWRLDVKRQNELALHPDRALPGVIEIPDGKFTQYLFGGANQKGLAKGVAFTKHLGYNMDNWQEMRDEILAAAPRYPATVREQDEYGVRYTQRVVLYGKKKAPMNVKIGWNLKPSGECAMTTAMPEEV